MRYMRRIERQKGYRIIYRGYKVIYRGYRMRDKDCNIIYRGNKIICRIYRMTKKDFRKKSNNKPSTTNKNNVDF